MKLSIDYYRNCYTNNRHYFLSANKRARRQGRKPVFASLSTAKTFDAFMTKNLKDSGQALTPENFYSLSCDFAEVAGENADS